jgi:hypothetical protein
MERIEFWREELKGSRVYDGRAKRSLSRICAALEEKSGESFSSACAGSLRQNGGRLFAHEETQSEGLHQGHYEQTALRCSAKEIVVAQDTTELNYTTHQAKTGLGHIGSSQRTRGVLTQTALALTREGLPLGIIGQKSWTRSDATFGKKVRRRQSAIEDKESYKWIEGLRWAERLSESATKVIVVGDREGDVYEFLSAPRRANVSLIVRAAQARRVSAGESADGHSPRPSGQHVFSAINAAEAVGTRIIQVEREKGLKDIELDVKIYAAQVHCPKHFGSASGSPKTIPIWIVQAQESDQEQADAISWTLLCTERTDSAADAFRRLDDYVLRWRVERFHYALKQGMKVEGLQFDDALTLMNAVSVYSLVAWRLMFITYYARVHPTHPSSEILSAQEQSALSAKAKRPTPTVGEAVLEIAKLGGYRQSKSPPGLKVIWKGLFALQFLTAGFALALSQKDVRQD